ncbi:MAG: Rrf2 family transcriptional regulator [Clostridia bacterium]|nr:Rrf2 family transcriptional regulator [Clostridia bacterium]
MLISTRGRYALRVMIDLAINSNGEYIAMNKIAQRQELSLKYLERILPVLTQNNIVEGIQGRGGGYRLTRDPKDYKIGEILRLTEGDLAPVSCLEYGAQPCSRAESCPTLPMWVNFHHMVNDYFDSITLDSLLQSPSNE